ncbi:MAG: type II secretion system F family protein [Candidatus Aenigmarchaeota archaeon]|nr:type II secretion system F family protein [Candidatus Aenigmarchaeota archaeon]
MKMKRSIPFLPLPLEKALEVSGVFQPIGNKLVSLFPSLDLDLRRIDLDVRAREYANVAVFAWLFWFVIMFFTMVTVSKIAGVERFFSISILVSLTISTFAMFYVLVYPSFLVKKKVKKLERDLLFAMRHLYIQIKSGVPLFESLVSVAKSGYGVLSKEIELCVKKISTGWPETRALEEMAIRNPSLLFRRAVWQITNSIRTGTDLGDTLSSIVETIAVEQKIAIRRYGSQLNPMVMMYMMLGVIVPSLGITFLMIISSFTGLPITKDTFILILIFLVVFQFNFLGFIKSRRPAVEI